MLVYTLRQTRSLRTRFAVYLPALAAGSRVQKRETDSRARARSPFARDRRILLRNVLIIKRRHFPLAQLNANVL